MVDVVAGHVLAPAGVASSSSTTDKVCLVTGGSSGIGAAVCHDFLQRGYKVLSIARRPCPHEGVHNLLADLGVQEGMKKAADEAYTIIGSKKEVHIIHCASSYPNDTADKPDLDGMNLAFQLNIVAPSVLLEKLLPLMAPGSSLILCGSTLSEKAVPGKLSYCTAKHAMVGFMRATTQDLFSSGVHTVLVCPGITDTPMVRDASKGNPEAFESFVKDLQGRILPCEEIAAVMAQAALQPVLNGSVIHCNGGQREK